MLLLISNPLICENTKTKTTKKMFQDQGPGTSSDRGVDSLDPQTKEDLDLTSIDPLRSNVLLSKLPIHQLSKRGTTEIRLISRPEPGAQIDTYLEGFS